MAQAVRRCVCVCYMTVLLGIHATYAHRIDSFWFLFLYCSILLLLCPLLAGPVTCSCFCVCNAIKRIPRVRWLMQFSWLVDIASRVMLGECDMR